MDNDYNEYEEDIEKSYDSDEEEDNKSFYTNNSDNENYLSDNDNDLDNDVKKNVNSEKEENENDIKNEDSLSEEEEDEEEDSDNDIEIEDNNNKNQELLEYEKKIKAYKKNNVEMFSKLGMISFICNVVDYVKNGGYMIDNRNDIEFPNDTEESYVFESILLDTIPFEYVINKHLINVSLENKIICLKLALRCVDENKKIFFTKNFSKRFPNFKKNLFNNNISIEEINEIKNIKKTLNMFD